MRLRDFSKVVSLGRDCQPVIQIRRHFGKQRCPSGVFDFQVTPHDAVIEYIKRDFRGCFQRGELVTNEKGVVAHTRLKTLHLHEFPDGLDAGYERALSRHNHVCENLRKIVHGREPTLFVVRSTMPAFHEAVTSVIRSTNPLLRFHVLLVPDRPDLPPTQPFPNDWQGNDDYYTETFLPYSISDPSGAMDKLINKAAAILVGQTSRLRKHLIAAKF